jgi:hypothetical protein
MNDSLTKTPWHLWLVGVVAVLFNSIGVIDFVMSMARGADYVLTNGGAVMGQQMAITSGVITVSLVVFAWYSRFMAARGVLR